MDFLNIKRFSLEKMGKVLDFVYFCNLNIRFKKEYECSNYK